MDLRNILRSWRERRSSSVPISGASDGTDTEATELVRQARQQLQRSQYAEAAHSLLRAIELRHDYAEAHHHLGVVYLEEGRFEDATDHLELATHFAPRLVAAHLDLGAALIELGRHAAAESACNRALELDPHCAAAQSRLGYLAKARGELEQAVEHYRAAIRFDPTLADVHCQLGFLLYKLGRYEESLTSHAAALAVRPDFAEAHHNRGLVLLETGYPQEALASFERACALRPDTAATQSCIGHALRDLGRLDEAMASYDGALKSQPQLGDALINRCYTLLMREQYGAGWAQYEQRFAATATALRGFPFAEWRKEPLAGKRILVYAEQGLGDEIMFASCLPDLLERCENVVIECNTRLAQLYARAFPQAIVHGGSKADDKAWLAQLPPVDFQVAIGSLPLRFRQARTHFPARRGYLMADERRVESWRRRLAAPAGRLRVGIAWRGGSLRTRQLTRSIPLAQWLPLLRQSGIEFISLQYGDTAPDLAQLRDAGGVALRDFGGELDDLDELAALIGALDLVISVDNTVVHLAGALGQNVWALLTCAPEWRYRRQGADMPWYPSARLFRQLQSRAWEPVLEQVGQALQESAGMARV